MKHYAVTGVYKDNGQIFVDYVKAKNMSHAFFVSAQGVDDPSNLDFISATPIKLQEGKNIEYAGSAVVDGATILEQEDVFNSPDAKEEYSDDILLDTLMVGHEVSALAIDELSTEQKVPYRLIAQRQSERDAELYLTIFPQELDKVSECERNGVSLAIGIVNGLPRVAIGLNMMLAQSRSFRGESSKR